MQFLRNIKVKVNMLAPDTVEAVGKLKMKKWIIQKYVVHSEFLKTYN